MNFLLKGPRGQSVDSALSDQHNWGLREPINSPEQPAIESRSGTGTLGSLMLLMVCLSGVACQEPSWQELQPWWMKPGHKINPATLTIYRNAVFGVGQPYHVYSVQRSVDLVSWVEIGQACSSGTGNFAFCDTNRPASASAFYRAVMVYQPWD